MAAGTKADFKIYDEQYFGGQFERQAQNLSVFNAASNGALVLTSKLIKGDFEKESFIKEATGLIARRDPTSLAAVADMGLGQDELVGVKLNKRIGPVAQTLDAWKKIAQDPQEFSFYVGQMVADEKLKNMVNTALSALAAGLANQANVTTTVAATIQHSNLVDAMAKFGDQAARISAFVMHSKVYFDLVKQALTDKIFGVANVAIYQGTVATFGKPTIVVDSPNLVVAGAPNTYRTLGLVPNAALVEESEQESMVFLPVTGQENLVHRLQGEYAYNLRIKGMAYDTAQGANPTDAIIGTGATWIKRVVEDKNLGGVCLVTQ